MDIKFIFDQTKILTVLLWIGHTTLSMKCHLDLHL